MLSGKCFKGEVPPDVPMTGRQDLVGQVTLDLFSERMKQRRPGDEGKRCCSRWWEQSGLEPHSKEERQGKSRPAGAGSTGVGGGHAREAGKLLRSVS